MNRLAALIAMLTLTAPALAQPVLPGANGSVCDFIAASGGKTLVLPKDREFYEMQTVFSDYLIKNAVADVDGDGDNEVLVTYYWNGDSPRVLGLKPDYAWSGELPEAADPKDLFRWTERGAWLHYGDEWHTVEFADHEARQAVYVLTYGKTGAEYSCSFLPRFEESLAWPVDDPAVAAAYEKIRKRSPYESFSHKTGEPLTANDSRYLMALESGFIDSGDHLYGKNNGMMREVSISAEHAVVAADFDRDGKPERVAHLELQSGAGGGCGAMWFELLPEAGQATVDATKRNLLLALQGVSYGPGTRFPSNCGSVRELININGKGYLYSEEADFGSHVRKLEELRNGHVYAVAQSAFTPEHTIVYDRSKGGLINKGVQK